MANHNNVPVQRVFVSHHSQNCWAFFAGKWRKVGVLSVDGTSNVHIALTAARANNMTVTATTDAADNNIEIVYL